MVFIVEFTSIVRYVLVHCINTHVRIQFHFPQLPCNNSKIICWGPIIFYQMGSNHDKLRITGNKYFGQHFPLQVNKEVKLYTDPPLSYVTVSPLFQTQLEPSWWSPIHTWYSFPLIQVNWEDFFCTLVITICRGSIATDHCLLPNIVSICDISPFTGLIKN